LMKSLTIYLDSRIIFKALKIFDGVAQLTGIFYRDP
jgi:hypothetical protein